MKFKLSRAGLLGNIAALLTGTSVARVLSALSVIIVSRQLGPELLGQYAANLAVVRLTAVLFSIGLDRWLLYSGGRDRRCIGEFAIASVVVKAVLGAGWIILMLMVTPLLNQNTFSSPLLLLSALSVWFEELARIGWSAFKAALKNRTTLLLTVGSEALLLLATVVVAVFGANTPRAYLFGRMIAFFVSSVVSILSVILVFRGRFHSRIALLALKDTVPFSVSLALATAYKQADITIIAHWLGRTAAGLYSPAISLASTFFLIPAAITDVMIPVLSRHYTDNTPKARMLSQRLITWSAILAVVLGSGLAVTARHLVQFVYGAEYALSGDVLAVLGGVLAFRTASFGLGTILVALGMQNRRVGIQAISAVVNVGLSLLIVRFSGILGIAWVYVLSEVVLTLGYAVSVWQWMRRSASLEGQKQS